MKILARTFKMAAGCGTARHAEHGPKKRGGGLFVAATTDKARPSWGRCAQSETFSCLPACTQARPFLFLASLPPRDISPNFALAETRAPKEIAGAPRPLAEGCGFPAPILARSEKRGDLQRGQRVAKSAQPKRKAPLVTLIHMRRSAHKHSTCGLVAMASA